MPDVVLLKILTFLSFHEVALLRVVSGRFNTICQAHLNQGFMKIKTTSAKIHSDIESRLPNRPSQRLFFFFFFFVVTPETHG
jgi:phage antirepressor YoqD-like protein